MSANNKDRRQRNEKFTYHWHNAWVGYRYSTLLQYVEQFAKKSKTSLCKQNWRHYYVNNKSGSFILYNTNRVFSEMLNTRFVLLKVKYCLFWAKIHCMQHLSYFANILRFETFQRKLPSKAEECEPKIHFIKKQSALTANCFLNFFDNRLFSLLPIDFLFEPLLLGDFAFEIGLNRQTNCVFCKHRAVNLLCG